MDTRINLDFIKQLLERKACFSAGIKINRSLDVLPDSTDIKILVLGDWGSGSKEQKNIAERSAITCDQLGCDLVLMLGDNFIQYGVKNLQDSQFQEKFESIYSQKVPFYPVLGNHDLRGNWRAQIEYSNHSDRWTMPDSNYDFIGGPVQFIGINTSCTICSLWNLLPRRKKTWRVVFGHRPIITQGRHRGMNWLEKLFLRFSAAQLYCCGHNHILEHFRLGKMDQITSGGGGSPLENENNKTSSKASFLHPNHGYVWVHFNLEKMCALFFDHKGEEIYQFSKNPN